MPTDTFYNLPAEKRCRLVKAIYGELARVPFSQMSINRIIKAAQIPRGSYYQYFRDRDDLYGYILAKTLVLGKALIRERLAACRGDLFAAMPEILSRAAAYLSTPDGSSMGRHLAEEIHLREMRTLVSAPRDFMDDLLDDVWEQLDKGCIRAESREVFYEMLPILSGVFARHLIEILAGADPDETEQRFSRAMDWLRCGMEVRA